MKQYYPSTNSSLQPAELESKILSYWQQNDIFKASVEEKDSGAEFVFYDGPPFANGLPHYGHLLTGFIKDTIARYQTMLGNKVERRFGWDCHGLPAEMGAEKELAISGRIAITEFGIDKFNEHCRSSVMKYAGEWEKYVQRQARWVDFHNSYKTMDINFMESVIWAFSELYKKGYVYQSMKVMPYSWACETPLSNFETRLDNSYRERADKAVTVAFNVDATALSSLLKLPIDAKSVGILAWTTTPWTLPSNLALAIGGEINYCLVEYQSKYYVIAEYAIAKYPKELPGTETQILATFPGKILASLSYEPLFDYFAARKNAFKIFTGDFVVEGDGTGIVHMAPGFGEDDQLLCEQHEIELVCPVAANGSFTSEVPDLEGINIFDANDKIILKLKNQGNWIKTEQYLHNYPHCWRTDTPLIYKAVPSWYVKVTEFKDRMVELNKQINWIPGHVQDGLFGKWLENARDWAISRKRFWGTPIPVWQSDDPKYPRIDVFGSIAEIERDFGVKVADLHRPFIDSLVRPNPDDPTGKSKMRRVEDVFDCWFESGSMPYGQVHYPFENKDWFENHFPADFIVEYAAQTRGWFYTLMVLSTALFDRPPFLNCICHGVILDATGQKLSKRLNNYADPMELFAKYGSDALRMTMLASTVVKGSELLIDKEGRMVYDTLRLSIKPIWNAYHFFTLYANTDNIEAKLISKSANILDQFILSKLRSAIESIKQSMDNYDTQTAYQAINDFFEILNNWYIRRSRARFWQSSHDEEKISAYNTLYTCLDHMCRAAAPLLPMLTEEIFLGLHYGKNIRSVHLQDFPDVSSIPYHHKLTEEMEEVIDICSAVLFIRSTENIRVRQPLQQVTIVGDGLDALAKYSDLIRDEVNVKHVVFSNELTQFATQKLAINFPVVGKRLPTKVKDIIAASKNNLWSIEGGLLQIGGVELTQEEYEIKLIANDPKASKTLSKENGLVIVTLAISRELYLEGLARDIIRLIQQARKNAELDVADHIQLVLSTEASDLTEAIALYSELIEEQTLSKIYAAGTVQLAGWFAEAVKTDEYELMIHLTKMLK